MMKKNESYARFSQTRRIRSIILLLTFYGFLQTYFFTYLKKKPAPVAQGRNPQ